MKCGKCCGGASRHTQHNRNAGNSAFDFESLDLFLRSQEPADNFNTESQYIDSTLQNRGKDRGSESDFESLQRFLRNQEYDQGFELDTQNVYSASQVLEDEGGIQHNSPDLSDVNIHPQNNGNESSFTDWFDLNNHPANLVHHPPSPYVKNY